MKELLAELFSRYYKDVYTYFYGLCYDASLSEDLTSEVFLEVVRSIVTFRGESDIKTWLFAIARHRWYAYLRGKSRQPQTQSIQDLYDLNISDPRSGDPPDGIEQTIASLLASESELTRDVFRLRTDGYSYFEIGSKLGITENSARVIFFRAKARIKKILEKEGFLS